MLSNVILQFAFDSEQLAIFIPQEVKVLLRIAEVLYQILKVKQHPPNVFCQSRYVVCQSRFVLKQNSNDDPQTAFFFILLPYIDAKPTPVIDHYDNDTTDL